MRTAVVPRSTLVSKIRPLGINKNRFRTRAGFAVPGFANWRNLATRTAAAQRDSRLALAYRVLRRAR